MRTAKFYATTALSICLLSVPAIASETATELPATEAPAAEATTTDSAANDATTSDAMETPEEATDDEVAMFAPLVQPCIAEPEGDACAPVRALVSSCAAEMKPEKCEVIFDEGNAVFEDAALVSRMQEVLQYVDEMMPEFDSPKPDGLSEEVLESERLDAETLLLLGDENQMTHSSPPVQDGDTDDLDETETHGDGNATAP